MLIFIQQDIYLLFCIGLHVEKDIDRLVEGQVLNQD